MVEQFAALGVTVEEDVGDDTSDVLVWRQNWRAFQLFRACGTQWATPATMDRVHYVGLRYEAVDVVMRRLGYDDDDFARLQIIEREAAKVLNESV